MDRQERLELILDHYENPRHRGPIPDADVSASAGNPGCGDIVTVHLRVDDQERAIAVAFEGTGCTISQAGASMVTELIDGKTLDEIETVPHDAVIQIMGKDLAMTRPRCATLGLNTARMAVRQFRRTKLMRQHGIAMPAGLPSAETVELGSREEQDRFLAENRRP